MSSRTPILIGCLALLLMLLAQALAPASLGSWARDRLLLVEARLGRAAKPPHPFGITVIDIDQSSIAAVGSWPWPRLTIARLVRQAALAGPAAIGTDILFADPDGRSPAALARQLAQISRRPELRALAAELPDGDAELAAALQIVPAALGFVLDPDGDSHLPGAAFLTTGRPVLHDLWQSPGALGPTAKLMEAASGLGALSLPGESDGVVRQIPLLVAAGPVVLPGLALETLRLALGSPIYRLNSDDHGSSELILDDWHVPLPPAGLLRIAPLTPGGVTIRTTPAAEVLDGKSRSLRDQIVLIGGSAAELGGLRSTISGPLTPSVQIEAQALSQLLERRIILDAPRSRLAEFLASLVLGGLAIATALTLGPGIGVILLAAACLVWNGGALLLLHLADRLLDPASPVFVALAVFTITASSSFTLTRKRERRLRASFGQRLHPAVVERLVRQPDRLKLAGERRQVTALVTDLEGFTGLAQRIEPQALINLLDRYLDGISRIVVEHGGMIDKLVGDAVHAIFNAPLDLPGHARYALAAACSIQNWTTQFQTEPQAAAAAFGRTRIGLESGLVVVGDVGIGTRLDYTAYGDAINLAVRLEGLNKIYGTSIMIGPAMAVQLAPALVRSLGLADVRGRDQPIEVFTAAGQAALPTAP